LQGFKCSQGSEQFPNMFVGCTGFFIRGKLSYYCSDVTHEQPAMVTGCYSKAEDLHGFLQEHPIINRLLDMQIRGMKISRKMEEEIHF
jgi:hypothetical protein